MKNGRSCKDLYGSKRTNNNEQIRLMEESEVWHLSESIVLYENLGNLLLGVR